MLGVIVITTSRGAAFAQMKQNVPIIIDRMSLQRVREMGTESALKYIEERIGDARAIMLKQQLRQLVLYYTGGRFELLDKVTSCLKSADGSDDQNVSEMQLKLVHLQLVLHEAAKQQLTDNGLLNSSPGGTRKVQVMKKIADRIISKKEIMLFHVEDLLLKEEKEAAAVAAAGTPTLTMSDVMNTDLFKVDRWSYSMKFATKSLDTVYAQEVIKRKQSEAEQKSKNN